MDLADDYGSRIYQDAGFDPGRPLRRGAVPIAVRLYGDDILYLQPRAANEAAIASFAGRTRIVLRRGTSPTRTNYLVAEMVARLRLLDECWFRALDADKQLEVQRALGAWVVAPRPAVRAFGGYDIESVAGTFTITQTCAAMRIAEAGGPATVVTTPTTVHRRGLLAWARDEDIRKLAAGKPRNVRKAAIRDEPGRVALLAKTS